MHNSELILLITLMSRPTQFRKKCVWNNSNGRQPHCKCCHKNEMLMTSNTIMQNIWIMQNKMVKLFCHISLLFLLLPWTGSFYKGSFSNEKHNSCKLPSILITLGVCANNKFVLEKWVIVWSLQTKKTSMRYAIITQIRNRYFFYLISCSRYVSNETLGR